MKAQITAILKSVADTWRKLLSYDAYIQLLLCWNISNYKTCYPLSCNYVPVRKISGQPKQNSFAFDRWSFDSQKLLMVYVAISGTGNQQFYRQNLSIDHARNEEKFVNNVYKVNVF